jgi:hypothetical protein
MVEVLRASNLLPFHKYNESLLLPGLSDTFSAASFLVCGQQE